MGLIAEGGLVGDIWPHHDVQGEFGQVKRASVLGAPGWQPDP